MAGLPIYVFEPWNRIDLGNEDYFVAQILRWLGIDVGRIVKIEHPVIISELLVPAQKYGQHLLARPPKDFLRFLLKSQRRIESEVGDMALLPRKIYVSRALLDPSQGKVAGEAEFERFLERSGYHIFHPQEHSLSRQVQVYVNAEKLIFCEGSAIHACILLPRVRAKLAIVLRRRISGIESQFAGFGKKVFLVESILSERSCGLPEWHGVTTIDYWECSRLLCDEGFIHERFDQWPAMAQTQERQALAAYVRAIAANARFLAFLLDEDSPTTAEASLRAVLHSRSWRITAPLRWANRLLTRIRATLT
jgi:capsular polysaccharide biosynthesis protein